MWLRRDLLFGGVMGKAGDRGGRDDSLGCWGLLGICLMGGDLLMRCNGRERDRDVTLVWRISRCFGNC
jgi:hypothetical protein